MRKGLPSQRLQRALTSVVAALSLGLAAACSRPGPVAPTPTTAPPRATTATAGGLAPTSAIAPSRTPPPTPLPSPTPGPRVFSVGLAGLPGTLDPANALDRSALMITRHLYDGLVAYAPGGTRPVPALAESWFAAPDGLTWTFQMRPGAVFSDGSPVTAEAARLNFARWMSATPPGPYAFWRAVFGGFDGEMDATGEPLALVAGVSAPEPATLVISLNRPDASLPNSLALPSFGLVNPSAFSGGNAAGLEVNSAGAGAYVLADASQTGLVRLVRNVLYWAAGEPSLAAGPDELVFKVISDDTQRLLALQTGEIEAMAELNPADYAAAASPSRGTRVEFDPALNVLYLGFNHAHSPWGNVDCRQAVAYALDRARYVLDYFPGDALLAETMQPPAVWGYAAPADAYRFNPILAGQHWQACLAAGVTLPVTVTLYVPPIPRPYLPDPAGLGQAIRADLQALSLTVEVASPDWETTWLADVHTGRADLFLLGWSGINGDPDAFLCPLFCGLEGAFMADENGQPAPPDAELANLLRQARVMVDLDRREALYAQAHERLRASAPAVPLSHRQSAWAFRADVQGYTPSPIESLFGSLFRP
jgi:peptide/nickel transport system substrate-binding protein